VLVLVGLVGAFAVGVAVGYERHPTKSGPEVHRLFLAGVDAEHIRDGRTDADLLLLASQVCRAASQSDYVAALLPVKAKFVASAYARNDLAAIEAFRATYRLVGVLICPGVAGRIDQTSQPLL
jgi:hypothetical protein